MVLKTKKKNYNELIRVIHALLWTAVSPPQNNIKFLTFVTIITIKSLLFPDVFSWYELSKVGKLRMFKILKTEKLEKQDSR